MLKCGADDMRKNFARLWARALPYQFVFKKGDAEMDESIAFQPTREKSTLASSEPDVLAIVPYYFLPKKALPLKLLAEIVVDQC